MNLKFFVFMLLIGLIASTSSFTPAQGNRKESSLRDSFLSTRPSKSSSGTKTILPNSKKNPSSKKNVSSLAKRPHSTNNPTTVNSDINKVESDNNATYYEPNAIGLGYTIFMRDDKG